MRSFRGLRLILWGDRSSELATVEALLLRLGSQVRWGESFEEVKRLVEERMADLVLAHLCQGCRGPLDLLAWLERVKSPPPVLVVTSPLDVNLYLEAMSRGAFDCVGLPLDEKEFVRLVSLASDVGSLRLSA